jgi:hypothetical protein
MMSSKFLRQDYVTKRQSKRLVVAPLLSNYGPSSQGDVD